MKTWILLVLLGCLGIVPLFRVTAAAETIVEIEEIIVGPLSLQAQLVIEVLKYSSRQIEPLVVGIIYVPDTHQIAVDVAQAFEQLTYQKQGIRVLLVTPDALETLDQAVNLLYVMPGNAPFLDMIAAFAERRKAFSCSGVPEYVQQKKIALSFELYQGKRRIVLCLPAAKSTEHEFKNPKFLNLQTTNSLRLVK